MTCIVGLKHKKKVYIGGDSCTTAGYETRATSQKKVFRIGNNDNAMLIGNSGSLRTQQILKYNVTPPKITQSVEKYLVREFVPLLRKTLKEHGWIKKENETEEISGQGGFIIGLKGQIFCIYQDFQVHAVEDNIHSIGSGGEYALGAMLAMPNSPPKQRILTALSIAGELTMSVSAPYYVETL